MLRGLLEAVHGITRAKVGGALDPAQSAEEREAYADWASRLGHGAIHRLWQLLLKGLAEVHGAPMPLEAAEMAILRVIHASDLPDPAAIMERLASGDIASAPAAEAPRAEEQAPLLRLPATFPDLVEALDKGGKAHIAQQLHDFVGLVSYAPPELVVRPAKPLPADFLRDLWQPRSRASPEPPGRSARPTIGGFGRLEPARPGEGGGRAAAPGGARRASGQGRLRSLSRSRACRLQTRRTTERMMENLDELLKMAQDAQAKLMQAQEDLDHVEVEGVSGGGLVRIRASAKGRIISIDIDESLLAPSEKQMVEDLVAAAINDARAKADVAAQEAMRGATGGLQLPPGFKMPF